MAILSALEAVFAGAGPGFQPMPVTQCRSSCSSSLSFSSTNGSMVSVLSSFLTRKGMESPCVGTTRVAPHVLTTTPSTRMFEGPKDAAHYVDLDEEPVGHVVPQILLLAT